MRHETSRDARATGEAPAPRDRAGEGGAHAVRGGPPAVGVGEFGVPLVAGVSARWASGTAGQADARAPVEAVGRPETDIGASAGARSAPGRAPTLSGDPRVALRFARLPGSIHLLLTDVVMPLMGGGQLAEEFRVVRPNAKVLFMSAYNVESVEAYRVQLAPGEPFLSKPFTMDDLQDGPGGTRLPRRAGQAPGD